MNSATPRVAWPRPTGLLDARLSPYGGVDGTHGGCAGPLRYASLERHLSVRSVPAVDRDRGLLPGLRELALRRDTLGIEHLSQSLAASLPGCSALLGLVLLRVSLVLYMRTQQDGYSRASTTPRAATRPELGTIVRIPDFFWRLLLHQLLAHFLYTARPAS